MQIGVFFFSTVDMPDAGADGPDPQDRRYGQEAIVNQYDDLFAYARTAEDEGFDSMWLAEHHFQHEGYEVTPNILMTSLALAMRTERIKFGGLVNVLPNWHPIHFAEDFAFADVVTRGRMLCGIGRGTVPRETAAFGLSGIGWNSSNADLKNRALFEEQVAVIKKAWHNERFSHEGACFRLPPWRMMDRGRKVTEYTLVPRPWNLPVQIWQAVTSPPTLEYTAREGHMGVFRPLPPTRRAWPEYGRLFEQHHGTRLRAGENRMMVVHVIIGDTTEEAIRTARGGHDELRRFLWPYHKGNKSLGMREDRPLTLEESMAGDDWVVGSVEDVRKELLRLCADFGIEYLTIFPHLPGMTRADALNQLRLFMKEIAPALRDQAKQYESHSMSPLLSEEAAVLVSV